MGILGVVAREFGGFFWGCRGNVAWLFSLKLLFLFCFLTKSAYKKRRNHRKRPPNLPNLLPIPRDILRARTTRDVRF